MVHLGCLVRAAVIPALALDAPTVSTNTSVRAEYDRGKRAYLLTYPGLTLVFPVPEEYEDAFLSKTPLDLTSAMKFPDGTQPLLSNVCVFQGTLRAPGSAPNAAPLVPGKLAVFSPSPITSWHQYLAARLFRRRSQCMHTLASTRIRTQAPARCFRRCFFDSPCPAQPPCSPTQVRTWTRRRLRVAVRVAPCTTTNRCEWSRARASY